ncbi:hypothetical protein MSAN_00960300 [Mycena sanguinolenta]|uniref:Condensation domain-containing protein n=1 Tax=Mycena sanguinolenta TaxID=230812 RepID=A0A8H6YXZ7_9AGAR|nr:hypothetical protein MSAN_00960300 [Mycena sanguinolenta]
MAAQPAHGAMAEMPTYRRNLSPNELSYFLPSRAYGLNDLINRMVIHAPPSLISPLRVRIAWAIIRLRHSLLACRVEMAPGCYDEAQFALTPPSSPSQALAEATACVRIFHDATGPELMHRFLNGSRTLASDTLSRLDVACHGQVSPGTHEFHLILMIHHMINDSLATSETEQLLCELLGGPATPGGAPRTDAELGGILDEEWKRRWGCARILGRGWSRVQEAAWKIDHQNIQKQLIGGHVFPRSKSPTGSTSMRLIHARFSLLQTKKLFATCKAQRVTLANATFAAFNFAWIRLYTLHPEIEAPKDLPMLMYTAISLRRHLPRASPLESNMSLGLEYHGVVLPAFLPRDEETKKKVFWERARKAQAQMRRHARSPLLLQRAVVSGMVRAERAKAWARVDDGTSSASSPAQNPNSVPSLALLGITHAARDPSASAPASRLSVNPAPQIKVVDMCGAARKAPGGLLVTTHVFAGQFRMSLCWDADGFAPGLMEEFWGCVVDAVCEFVIGEGQNEPSSTKGEKEREQVEVVDCLKDERGVGPGAVRGRAKL